MKPNQKISECENHHFYLSEKDDMCPRCGEKETKIHDIRDGDCVYCGQLCPGHAYGCTQPSPIEVPNTSTHD